MVADGGIKSGKPCPRGFSISRGFPIPGSFPIPRAFPMLAEFSTPGSFPMSGGIPIPGKFPMPGRFPVARGFPIFLAKSNPSEARSSSKASELSETKGEEETVAWEIKCEHESNCD